MMFLLLGGLCLLLAVLLVFSAGMAASNAQGMGSRYAKLRESRRSGAMLLLGLICQAAGGFFLLIGGT